MTRTAGSGSHHLGTFECKLCLTLHNNEGNYLAHTQGKRHQQNLARRAAREERDAPSSDVVVSQNRIEPRKTIKIGRPGYKVVKQMDPETKQRSLLFQIDYPEIEEGLQPRHRFMSAYEQRIEAPDKAWQYLLFAAEPYETVAFKVPNREIDKDEGKFFTHWDAQRLTFWLQLYFVSARSGAAAWRRAVADRWRCCPAEGQRGPGAAANACTMKCALQLHGGSSLSAASCVHVLARDALNAVANGRAHNRPRLESCSSRRRGRSAWWAATHRRRELRGKYAILARIHQHIGARAATSPAGRCREDLRLLDRTHVRIVEDQPAAIIIARLLPLRCLRLRPR